MLNWILGSLKNKLLVYFVGPGLTALSVVGFLTFHLSKAALEHNIEQALLNLAAAKANEMDAFLASQARIPPQLLRVPYRRVVTVPLKLGAKLHTKFLGERAASRNLVLIMAEDHPETHQLGQC